MNVEILKSPSNTAAKIVLDGSGQFTAEGGAMIAMSGDMSVETSIRKNKHSGGKGLLKGAARLLGREGLFLNTFTAGSRGGEVYLSPSLPGDITVLELDGSRGIKVQSASYMAHGPGVDLDISWGGLKNAFSGESLIWLSLTGEGKALINAFGMIYPVDVDGSFIVDTGNIAAYEEGLDFRISKAGGSWISSFLGGEGLVCRFEGRGRVWCQTHADRNFGAALTPFLTPKKED